MSSLTICYGQAELQKDLRDHGVTNGRDLVLFEKFRKLAWEDPHRDRYMETRRKMLDIFLELIRHGRYDQSREKIIDFLRTETSD